ncbi:hypothetical protein OHS59_29110 [Streptomyces sp. NBC_00414]|uniref:hypothetical protein n=1 Tax=Streptomyces sp. NBC_00414 TaxID=2975739 RepID=UPI002E224590
MSRITPLLDGDAANARGADDLVITEFGAESGEFTDSRICICWKPGPFPVSVTDGGRHTR